MQAAFAELPLALFTTLAPIGAGAFVTLALAFLSSTFSSEQLKRIDRMTIIPMAVVLLGFVASFVHLASPLHAPFVFSGVGASPLSNEIVAGSVFVVLALVYLVTAFTGRLSACARKGFAVIVALAALVFACFTALAYMMQTIISWNSPLLILQMVGFALAGGMPFGTLVLVLSGALEPALKGCFKMSALVLSVIGGLGASVAFMVQSMGVASLSNPMVAGSSLVAAVSVWVVAAVVCLVLSVVGSVCALLEKRPLLLSLLGTIFAFAGVFIARLVFYALQLSVGLSIG